LRVVVVDQQRTFADALAARLGREDDLTVIGMVPPATPDAEVIVAGGADIVLLDGDLPDDASLRLCLEISKRAEAPLVIVLSDSAEPQRIVRAIRAGAAAWIRKNETIEQLLLVLRAVARGEMWLPPAEMSHVVRLLLRAQDEQGNDDGLFAALTPREREVLRHLTEGFGREDVAEQLHLSRNTVRTHLQNLMAKLGVHSTLEAVVMARSRLEPRSPAPPV
jgi:two-component system NarL family response regulator